MCVTCFELVLQFNYNESESYFKFCRNKLKQSNFVTRFHLFIDLLVCLFIYLLSALSLEFELRDALLQIAAANKRHVTLTLVFFFSVPFIFTT